MSREDYVQIKPTILLPRDTYEKVREYMRRYGITSYAELVKHLIRKVILEKEE